MESHVGMQYGNAAFQRTTGRSSNASNPSQQWHGGPLSEMVMPTQDERSGLVSGMDDQFDFVDQEAAPPYVSSSARQANPTMSSFLEGEAPWTHLDNASSRRARSSITSIPAHAEFIGLPSRPTSENQSVASAQIEAADSGYFSGAPYDSRDDSLTVGLDIPSSLKRNSTSSTSYPRQKPIQEKSPDAKTSSRSKHNEFPCSYCAKMFKCRSDLHKHERWHLKPFKCDVPGCQRNQGFITQNDLDRHKKSKHFNGVYGKTKSYQCKANNCRNPSKIWPRLDNFKQHVSKMHPDQDTEEVIRRSRLATPAPMESSASAIDPTAITKSPPRVTITQDLNQTPPSLTSPIDQLRLSPTNASYSRPNRTNSTQTATDSGIGYTPTTAGLDALAAVAIGNTATSQSSNQQGSNPTGSAPNSDFLNSFAMNVMTAFISAMQQNAPATNQISAQQPGQQSGKNSPNRSRSSSKTQASPPKPPSPPANAPAEVFKLLETMVSTMKQAQANSEPEVAEQQEQVREDGGQKCPQCSKILKRNCDMNKHIKRHTKPYGCTFGDCDKVFGSKNDWKRHENSQHFQSEMWKCQQHKENKYFNKCEFIAYYEPQMIKHLMDEHFMNEVDAKGATAIGQIGRNNQIRFWCGFCGEAILLKNTAVKAWDERFNHIDEHFMKEGKRVDDWVDPVRYQTKKEMREEKERKKNGLNHAAESSSKAGGAGEQSRGKRAASPHGGDAAAAKRSKFASSTATLMFQCCSCDDWSNATASPRCTNCDHPRCGNCASEVINSSSL